MGNKSTSGFTIIETVLFLGISGILVVTLLAGTGVSINIQRYRDAVETFKSTLQDQYSELASVKNDRDDTWSCDEGAQTEQGNDGTPRGQSDCVLVGRYVTVDGAIINTYSVTARPLTNPPDTAETDIEKLSTGYELNVSTVNRTTTEMEWGTKIAWPTTGSEGTSSDEERSIALLFLRSPDSGLIYTFSSNDVVDEPTSSSLKELLVAGNSIPGQRERVICIDSGGAFTRTALLSGNLYAVVVSAYATGPSSIETRSNDLGGEAQC
jgi:type II secretory pathway pseudopilin PulG